MEAAPHVFAAPAGSPDAIFGDGSDGPPDGTPVGALADTPWSDAAHEGFQVTSAGNGRLGF
jgi:hypothetical protein